MDEEPALSDTLVRLLAALCNACITGDKLLVESLLVSNPDLLNHMYVPLQTAAQNDHFDIFQLLVAKSGGYNVRDTLPGKFPGPRRGDELLANACLDGHVDMVDMLIKDKAGTGAGRSSFGESALHAAVKRANYDICWILLEYNKHLNFNDGLNVEHALLCAIHMIPEPGKHMYPIIKLLLEFGGPRLANLTGWRECTPLHYAVMNNDAELMFILLSAGANPFLANDDGDTAWQIGQRGGTAETSEVWKQFAGKMGGFVQFV
jgi:ankyrin repeat protein